MGVKRVKVPRCYPFVISYLWVFYIATLNTIFWFKFSIKFLKGNNNVFLEEVVISTLKEFGIESGRFEGLTGVWIEAETPRARKICAMGVKSSRWVTMHGIGFNINTDLNYFSHIIPCGIDDKAVTSMKQELGIPISMEKVIVVLKQKFAEQFSFTYIS